MKDVFDPRFAAFGRPVGGVPMEALLDALGAFPLPEKGMFYSPREESLHAVTDFTPWGEKLYADMPYQLGYCAGENRTVRCLARHGGSAFICGLDDFDLLVCHRGQTRLTRFRVPARVLTEIYGDTLRSAPLARAFRVLVILPFGTNTEWKEGAGMRNTWLRGLTSPRF